MLFHTGAWAAQGPCAFALSPFLNTEFNRSGRLPTLRFKEARPGLHGGQRHLFRTIWNKEWLSQSRTTLNTDPQGDPRWPIRALGEELSTFLGLVQVSDREIVIPDAKELNGGLAVINSRLDLLHKPVIPIRFYSNMLDSEAYIEDFISKYALPMDGYIGGNGVANTKIHDISFHLGFFVVPSDLIQYAAARAHYWHSFIKYLKRRSFNPLRPHLYPGARKNMAQKLLKTFSDSLDIATAHTSSLIVYRENWTLKASTRRQSPTSRFFMQAIELLGEPTLTPAEELKAVIRNSGSIARDRYVTRGSLSGKQEYLISLLNSFNQTYTSPAPKLFDIHQQWIVLHPGLSTNFRTIGKWYEERIQQRLQEIVEALSTR